MIHESIVFYERFTAKKLEKRPRERQMCQLCISTRPRFIYRHCALILTDKHHRHRTIGSSRHYPAEKPWLYPSLHTTHSKLLHSTNRVCVYKQCGSIVFHIFHTFHLVPTNVWTFPTTTDGLPQYNIQYHKITNVIFTKCNI